MNDSLRYGEFDVRMSEYRENSDVQGPAYTRLNHARKIGEIRSAQIDGKLWLIKSQADAYLASRREEEAGLSCGRPKASEELKELKRIAAALEDVAMTCRQLLADRSAETI